VTGRLKDVADHHGGQVPLHSRLFSLWMHHAFPRECPYPHLAGSTNPLTPDEWITHTGASDSQASDDEMSMHIREDDSVRPDHGRKTADDLPWNNEEDQEL